MLLVSIISAGILGTLLAGAMIRAEHTADCTGRSGD